MVVGTRATVWRRIAPDRQPASPPHVAGRVRHTPRFHSALLVPTLGTTIWKATISE
ncbi:hypothetical protein B0H14DRAFT_3441527 [Mycena olivaceomarginata]|nr:hypothetical protein B0H14DRAFT_3441527 [Mycena olivaceomarginata]